MESESGQYKHLGVLLCMSSNAVMKVEEVERYIDAVAKMGYNVLELTIDDVYEVPGEPYFGYLRGGYSIEELKRMDSYAKQKGIELTPSIQVLGHMGNIVKIPAYSEIVDLENIILVDEPRTYELIDNMFKSLRLSLQTHEVNIGFDEAHLVGLGRYLDKHGYTDRGELLLRHLDKVLSIAKKYGFHCHMWSDMFFKLSLDEGSVSKDVRQRISSGVGLCYWDYSSEEEKTYDEILKKHKELGEDIWFAGSAITCQGFAPHNARSIAILQKALASVRRQKIKNVLVTLWGDDGKDCSYWSALPSLYAASQFAKGNNDLPSIKRGFHDAFGMSWDDFMLLDLPNINKRNPNGLSMNVTSKALLYNDVFLGWKDFSLMKAGMITFDEYANKLKKVIDKAGSFSYLFRLEYSLCLALSLKYDLGIKTRSAYKQNDRACLEQLPSLYKKTVSFLKRFRKDFKTMWFKENKPFGWEIQEIRLSGLIARIADCGKRLEDYLLGKLNKIEELEVTLLEYAPFESGFNQYRGFISPSDI